MMDSKIHILHLEDEPVDAELVQAKIAETDLSCQISIVQTRDDFETLLLRGGVELILADYHLPSFDGMSALRLVKENFPEIPFIFVSGIMGEEVAIDALTKGAKDYVLKHNLSRLPSAVKRALQESCTLRERKQAKEALLRTNKKLQASEAKYIDLYDNAPDMYMSVNVETGTIIRCNRTLAHMLERTIEEIVGRSVLEIYHPDCWHLHKEVFHDFLENGEIHDEDLQLQKKDGSKLEVSLNATAVRDVDSNLLISRSTLRDNTYRKQAEESIRKLSQAVEQSPVSIVITDLLGRIEFVNAKFSQITGYTSAEALGRNPKILKSHQTPAEEYRRLWQTISSGGVWQGELQNQKKNGELYWEHAIIAPIRNGDNVISHYVAVKEDITERKILEDQLHQSQKMEAVGQLAGGVAHDFNNMLGVIIGHAELALEEAINDEALRESIEQILSAGLRSADITRKLLAFARKQTNAPRILDLNETVEGMLKLLRRLIGEEVKLAWLPEGELWPVKMDPSQIDQILANLCVNARDAIDGIGRILIQTQNSHFDGPFCIENKEYCPGKYIALTVNDDGCGMEKSTMNKIFEPFFTTKNVGKGTGLGLATVYGIVKQNKGFIIVNSESGQGSTFTIYLPRCADTVELQLEDGAADQNFTGNETILVAEDEHSFLTTVKKSLERYGYQVLAASTPGEAVTLAKEYKGDIHLLLTDLIMPDMNGRELAKKITSFLPNISCLYMSGYTSDLIGNQGELEEGEAFIQKPFNTQALAFKIREMLDN